MTLALVGARGPLSFGQPHRAYGTALNVVHERLTKELDGIKEAGTWKAERVITTKQDVEIKVEGSKEKILNFCANNYLGLSVRQNSSRYFYLSFNIMLPHVPEANFNHQKSWPWKTRVFWQSQGHQLSFAID